MKASEKCYCPADYYNLWLFQHILWLLVFIMFSCYSAQQVTLSDGRVVNLAGEVGFLSRSVVIEGALYDAIDEDMFGGRILVAQYTNPIDGLTFAG